MSDNKSSPAWTLDGALHWCHVLTSCLRASGFSVALTGSVLRYGKSQKDLDIIIYPLQKFDLVQWDKAWEALEALSLERIRDREAVTDGWRARGSQDTKWVEEWRTMDGRRIDFFFLS